MIQKHKNILSLISSLSFVVLFFGAGLVENGRIDPNTYIWVQGVAVFLGLFTLVAAVEKMAHQSLSEFKSSAIWWALSLGILGYYARISALDDVNKVFHIDPNALPMTLIVAQGMGVFVIMKWPFIIVTSMLFLAMIFICKGSYFSKDTPENEKVTDGFFVFSSMITCLLCAIFIQFQLDDSGRQSKIYRIAHYADFVSKYDCSGIDQNKYSALFIGPEQRKILVAPKLPKANFFGPKRAEFLQPLAIPTTFPILDCRPSVNFQEWEKQVENLHEIE